MCLFMAEHLSDVGEPWTGPWESQIQVVLARSCVMGALLRPGLPFPFSPTFSSPKSCADLLKSPTERILKCVPGAPGSGGDTLKLLLYQEHALFFS